MTSRAYTFNELVALCQGMHPTLDMKARGALLAAGNDEPEPGDLTEADLAEIDRQFNIGRADRADRRALELQVQANLTDPLLRGCY